MTSECLERVKLYVSETRKQDVLVSRNSRLNGYNKIAADHDNRILLADMILRDIASEGGKNAV